jgi:hypothetical protein
MPWQPAFDSPHAPAPRRSLIESDAKAAADSQSPPPLSQ